jgi:hypothetical protein
MKTKERLNKDSLLFIGAYVHLDINGQKRVYEVSDLNGSGVTLYNKETGYSTWSHNAISPIIVNRENLNLEYLEEINEGFVSFKKGYLVVAKIEFSFLHEAQAFFKIVYKEDMKIDEGVFVETNQGKQCDTSLIFRYQNILRKAFDIQDVDVKNVVNDGTAKSVYFEAFGTSFVFFDDQVMFVRQISPDGRFVENATTKLLQLTLRRYSPHFY